MGSTVQVFPDALHLLVVTDRRIRKWDRRGISDSFRADDGAITAAREAGHGRLLLAVADGWLVILHDQTRDSSRQWTLRKPKVHFPHARLVRLS